MSIFHLAWVITLVLDVLCLGDLGVYIMTYIMLCVFITNRLKPEDSPHTSSSDIQNNPGSLVQSGGGTCRLQEVVK